MAFEGFLRAYVAKLSQTGGESLEGLAADASDRSPRTREPLFLMAVSQGLGGELVAVAPPGAARDEWEALLPEAERLGAEGFAASPGAPERYRKVWRAWRWESHDRGACRARTLAKLRTRMLESRGTGELSSACREAGADEGDVRAFLESGRTDAEPMLIAAVARALGAL